MALNEVLSHNQQVQDEPSFPLLEQPFSKGSSPPPHHLAHATPTHKNTLPTKFCQSIPEPSQKAPNHVLSDFEEEVRSMFPHSPLFIIHIIKEKKKKEVSRTKRDLFSWLILFQPELD